MKKYHFPSVEVPNGHLSISVAHRESLSNFNIDNYASFSHQIITDYVGSPANDPFRLFPSSVKGVSSTNSQFRGIPSYNLNPFQRPHSWTGGGIYRPPLVHQRTTLPYEPPSPPNDVYNRIYEGLKVPSHQRMPSSDEYQLSPPFSPCLSPSLPTSISGFNSIRMYMRAETAPASIPHPMMSISARYSPSFSPSRHSLPPMSPKCTWLDPSSQDSPSGIRISRTSDSSRAADSCHKGLRDSREDSGRFSALLSSSGSPPVGFSRSSSRLSFLDDLDECDFSCPFIVDDVDSFESLTSHNVDGIGGSSNTSQASSTAKKSQDSAVGALVLMLKHAPPLHHDSSSCYSSCSSCKTEVGRNDMAASGFFMTRKSSDAIEELRSYIKQ